MVLSRSLSLFFQLVLLILALFVLGCHQVMTLEGDNSSLLSLTNENYNEQNEEDNLNTQNGVTLLQGLTSPTLLKNMNTNFCIDVPASSTKAAIRLIQYECHGELNQLFEMKQTSFTNYFNLVNKASGLCMDIYGDSLVDGVQLIQYPCNGGQNQMFQFRTSSLGTQLVVKHSQKCIVPLSSVEGSELVQKTCDSNTSNKMFYWTTNVIEPPPSPSGLTRSGRNFIFNGKPIVLLGWDTQEIAHNPAVNYISKLDWLKTNGVNKVRIWIYCYWNVNFYHPWIYSNGVFNLEQFNEAYWTRVKNFLSAAKFRGIVVEVSLFSPNALDRAEDWSSTTARFAFNSIFNLNGAFHSNSYGHFNPEFHTLDYPGKTRSGKTLYMIQQALVDKTLAETSAFDNVYYEVSNEFPGENATMDETYPWALYWARYIKQRTNRLVGVHANQWFGMHNIGLGYFMNEPSIDVLTFHAGAGVDTDNQAVRISALWHSAQNKNKILQTNEGADPYVLGYNAATNHAFSYIISGASFSHYEDDAQRVGGSVSTQATWRLKILRDLATLYDFTSLSPIDSYGNEYDSLVVSGPAPYWQVLAKPGIRYLAYFSGVQSSTRTKVKVVSGTYTCIWIDPRSGTRLVSNSCISSSGVIDTTSPSPASWDRVAGLLLVVTK